MAVEQIPIIIGDLPLEPFEHEGERRVDHEAVVLAERRQKVARLYASKQSLRQIAQTLGVSFATAWNDLHFVLNVWRKAAVQDAHGLMAAELLRLESYEAELVGLSSLAQERGDYAESARIIGLAVTVLEKRCDLLGLNAKALAARGIPLTIPVKLVAGVVVSDVV